MAFYPDGYSQPMQRPMTVQAPMVSGYATVRLSTNNIRFIGSGLDTSTLIMLENTGTTPFTVQLAQTSDDSISGARTNIGGAVALVPRGTENLFIQPTQKYLEFYTTAGGGEIRAQVASRVTWNEMAFSKTDPFYPPVLVDPSPAYAPLGNLPDSSSIFT